MNNRILDMTSSPSSFLAYADAYLSAANILFLSKSQLNELFEIGPLFHLTGQSFELIAKSLLLFNGVSETDLRKPNLFGHDLWKLREGLEAHYDLRRIIEETQLKQAEKVFNAHRDDFEGLNLQQASDLLRFDWQLLALNENYYSYLDEPRPSHRSRYPNKSLSYKPVRLEILLPCLDCVRDFAFAEISKQPSRSAQS